MSSVALNVAVMQAAVPEAKEEIGIFRRQVFYLQMFGDAEIKEVVEVGQG
jgi:hypothetical protein